MYGIDIWLGYTSAQNSQTPVQAEEHKELLIDNVIFDVCNLLNSRSTAQNLGESVLETPSILDYGMPDVSYYSPYSAADQQTVCKIVEECLQRFEPRLTNVVVTPIAQEPNGDIGFYFRIKANIVIGREQIAVVLDSNFSLPHKQFLVTKQE